MCLFWKNGYEATSLADLTQAMGIGRQSLYNIFGDKHSLFVEAVKQCMGSRGQQILMTMQADGSPSRNIRNALEQTVDVILCGDCRGCLNM
jgi:TetR/AcrR family transcriptional regulator, transcriptional repressor for nem operon